MSEVMKKEVGKVAQAEKFRLMIENAIKCDNRKNVIRKQEGFTDKDISVAIEILKTLTNTEIIWATEILEICMLALLFQELN